MTRTRAQATRQARCLDPEGFEALRAADQKYALLATALRDSWATAPDEKLIVFSSFRGTIDYLEERLSADGVTCVKMHGSVKRDRDQLLRDFADTQGPCVLLTSEVGGEGLDLQFCRTLINYDLPWNPMRVEQRIGRIDRIGQRSPSVEIFSLVCDPTAFQGDERDIMFVSLVAEKQDSPLSGTGYEQRFNVATSRARDRMILVRSVELEDLRSSDKLRRALLEHFRAPFASEGKSAVSRRERCESGFETEMFDMLAERGYRIDTQVPVGNFRIDLVVEGENDRRLAIECDGDRYHGPDKWSDDMVRQRILERAGWEIWRCFASRFVRDRDGVLTELLALLQERGIEPVGSGEGWVSRHTELRRWSTPTIGFRETEAESESPAPTETEVIPASLASDALADDVMRSKPISQVIDQQQSRVTEGLVQREILHLLRDGKPWTNAEIKRALSESLPLSAADRARANFRPNEEKWEELVNNALAAARGNSLHAKGLIRSGGRGVHILAGVQDDDGADERIDPVVVPFGKPEQRSGGVTPTQPSNFDVYRAADFGALGLTPDPANLYDEAYAQTLRKLVSHIISVEGPIYDDVLAVRIARAHGKDRTGTIIRNLALEAVEDRFPRTREDDRVLFWPEGAAPDALVPFRKSVDGLRSHSDIPFAELASIAAPDIRAGLSDELILQRMTDTFGLARLRQATRARFLAAVEIARREDEKRSPQ